MLAEGRVKPLSPCDTSVTGGHPINAHNRVRLIDIQEQLHQTEG